MQVEFMSRRFWLPLFFLSDFILCKKAVSSPGLGANKLSECRCCKILTDSFNHWLENTSRGKYDGGDAAWEEAKLKSYSRSEIRLVEIQEGLCSELKTHQDRCYTLAEEVEQVLEKWWFDESSNSIDLYTWLCIETLQHCCPSNHFGDTCSSCPLDRNNVVCSGNGKCDGEGTRKGNGTCVCKKGYTGHLCADCEQNFFLTNGGSCAPCNKACLGCTGESTACISCKPGWQLTSGKCVDINECSQSICNTDQYCINLEGTYSCKNCESSCLTCNGEGPSNCTTCNVNNTLLSGMCINDDLKRDVLQNAFKRLTLYMGLLLMAYFVFRTSKTLASIVILIIAMYIYLSERSSSIKLLDIMLSWHS